jgi:hypothetical protein
MDVIIPTRIRYCTTTHTLHAHVDLGDPDRTLSTSAGVIAYLLNHLRKIDRPEAARLSVCITIMTEVPETHVLAVASHVRD